MSSTVKELKFIASRVRKSPLSMAGLTIIIFFSVIAIFAPVIAPPIPGRDPYMIPREGYSQVPKPPSESHIFGLAQGQYDIFYGCIWGTRTAFYIGFIITALVVLVGVIIGNISGYFGGRVDEVFMRITDIFYAIPSLILSMALVIIFGRSLNSIIQSIAVIGWVGYARMMRSEVIRVKGEDYVEAAKAVGSSHLSIILSHIMPNAIFSVIAMATLDIGTYVLYAASLTFLGLGEALGYADWGQMVAFSRNWIIGTATNPFEYWYTFVIPGVFIFTFTLGWSLLGDAFRDILDPMIRRK